MKSAAIFFSKEEQKAIKDAIAEAETNTSGEIRVHIENSCPDDVMDRAAYIFAKLEMQKTQLRNGVLFYLAIRDHKFAILGDAGINAKVSESFWNHTKEEILGYFKQGEFAKGLSEGIKMAGQQLKTHFPYQADDVNELSDDISFGDN
ncbi:TLP18.3/Psb32/MOLO-1 phosphatase superfamily protein [Ancylomarina subtilis]|uniref:TLP18.3/Psb32/MOLO-1 phosphatase superfamily protein n=1 Tax=Ancylomarina subtilis TaxID=1639035 RepID=A0A4V2FS76_9BACT|nr:TPM domain-containing protein [Ancylomarina subtilis]RZT93209.1 TLP18.3/Psb32/MOLO-1 phosphatase superfamily protein [Ancylomarina subtilis]